MNKNRRINVGGLKVDISRLLGDEPSLHPKVVTHLVRAVLKVTELHAVFEQNPCPDVAMEFLSGQIALILDRFYPEHFAYKRECEDRSAKSRAAWEAKQKKPIPQGLRTSVFERDRYRCISCGSHEKLSADHIIPESRGGPTTFDNLQTLCRSCNSRKNSKFLVASHADDSGF